MNRGIRAFSSVFTHYLCERDALTANMTRFGAGFILDSHIKEAKEQVQTIKTLIDEFERRKNEPKPKVILENAGGCGSCYRK